MSGTPDIRPKRAYETAAPGDGTRMLVERLWPRGLARAAAALDAWDRDIAPSPDLRRWYGHDPARLDEFRARYREELRARGSELDRLRGLAGSGPLTLVFATRDPALSSAAVLREVLLGRWTAPSSPILKQRVETLNLETNSPCNVPVLSAWWRGEQGVNEWLDCRAPTTVE